eukprot:CAMPEP_0170551152 /NCGR_PEP_ID=MMETSP0211-20121228/9184_1 /TAXON_ID=311385 /ORGANISM="Pseudokeronopsis sp., Strain OXSARD2" /LENGTH=33 /DNA_ID= /DNA_START= /DNA_END= /DNA_ORIENTATION=
MKRADPKEEKPPDHQEGKKKAKKKGKNKIHAYD